MQLELTGDSERVTPSPSHHSAAPGTVEKPCKVIAGRADQTTETTYRVFCLEDSVLMEAPVLQKDRRE